jgi:hypothetical protein
MAETRQRNLNLCSHCFKKASKNCSIKCRCFGNYFKKLPFCSKCKASNRLFLKNLFFKNFLLYKRNGNIFGMTSFLISFLICNLSLFDTSKLAGLFSNLNMPFKLPIDSLPKYNLPISTLPSGCLPLLFYFYLVFYSEYLTFFKISKYSFLTIIWHVFLRNYSFSYPILFLLCLKKIIFSSQIYFDVPINLLSADHIESQLDRLKIKTSSEVEHRR